MKDKIDTNNKEELYKWILNNPNGYFHVLKNEYNEFYAFLKNNYQNAGTIGEAVWLYCHNYTDNAECVCGKYQRFINVREGYSKGLCNSCYKSDRRNNSVLQQALNVQLTIAPKCKNTKCCNDAIQKKNGLWSDYCSTKCRGSYNSTKSRNKAQKTMVQNHGVEHALQSSSIMQSMIENNLKNHGVANVMQKPGMSLKVQQTTFINHGVISSFQDPLKYQASVDAAAALYGYPAGMFTNVSQIPEIHQEKLKSGYNAKDYILPSKKVIKIQGWENKFLDLALLYYPEENFNFDQYYSIIYYQNNIKHYYIPDFILNNSHVIEVKSNYTFNTDLDKNIAKAKGSVNNGYDHTFAIYRENGNSSYLTFSNKKEYIKNELIVNNIEFDEIKEFGDYYIDYFVKDKNIAICYRSVDFTNDIFLDNNYYYNMNVYFSNLGIQLIIINDKELSSVWINSLLSKLTTPKEKIYAKYTTLKLVKKDSIINFLNNNHVQGYASCNFYYGLYYQEELIAAMGFNLPRSGTGKKRPVDSYELVRYVTSMNVVGGASKILKNFIKIHKPNLIYSYSSNDISVGNMYKTLGFILTNLTKSDYKYYMYDHPELLNRFKYRNGNLKKLNQLPDDNKNKIKFYDDDFSEKLNMKANGYVRVYDSGKKTWELLCNNQ